MKHRNLVYWHLLRLFVLPLLCPLVQDDRLLLPRLLRPHHLKNLMMMMMNQMLYFWLLLLLLPQLCVQPLSWLLLLLKLGPQFRLVFWPLLQQLFVGPQFRLVFGPPPPPQPVALQLLLRQPFAVPQFRLGS